MVLDRITNPVTHFWNSLNKVEKGGAALLCLAVSAASIYTGSLYFDGDPTTPYTVDVQPIDLVSTLPEERYAE